MNELIDNIINDMGDRPFARTWEKEEINIKKILEKNFKNKIILCNTERYYLVNHNGERIMSSCEREEVEKFYNNMKKTGRFLKKDLEKMIIIDILSLGKYNNG